MGSDPSQKATTDRRVRKLGVWLVITNMAAAALLSGLFTLWVGDSRQAALERAQDNVRNVAGAVAQRVHGDIARVDLALQSLVSAYARNPQRGFEPKGPIGIELADLRAVLTEVDALLISDAQGGVQLGKPADMPPVQVSDRDFFIAARDTVATAAPVLSQPWVGRVSGKWVISVARALRNADGSFAGVVHANLSSERFSRQFAEVDLGQEGAIALRTDSLALVARITPQGPITEGLGGANVSAQLKAALAENPKSGVYMVRRKADGAERASAYQRVEGYPLYVIVGTGTDEYSNGLKLPQGASAALP